MGQTSFYNDPATWRALQTTPLLLVWGTAVEDPRGESYVVNNAKNKKALNLMYSATQVASNISNQITLSKKAAVFKLLSEVQGKDIEQLLKLDDPESQYRSLRDSDGKQHVEGLAIIFTGAYNNGIPCFSENYIPYDIVDKQFEYIATLKDNWRQKFPNVVMMQQSSKIDKSVLDRFLLRHSKKSTISVQLSSSSSSYSTPVSFKENYNISDTSVDDFDAYVDSTQKTLNTARILSPYDLHNETVMNEYELDMEITSECGNALICQSDSTSIEVEFNLDDRTFKGKRGTHKWKIFEEINIVGKIHAVEGDYLIVIGVRNNLVIVEDPCYDKDTSAKIRTFLLHSRYFKVVDLIHLSPEST